MIGLNSKIRRFVRYYTRIYGTNDPFRIAKYLNIEVYSCPLGRIAGYYKYLKRHRCIYINSDLDENFSRVVMAHELGHAILHVKENCTFMKSHTLLLTSGIEREANQFAAYLLITDDMLRDYAGRTMEQFCCCTGYPKELIELRLK
ncbi:MAG: ImmA/IrrE family metallo-endopeptidase [Bariatricus sp.]